MRRWRNQGGAAIFGVPGVTQEHGEANVLMLGTSAARDDGVMILRLMYLDPSQFEQRAAG